MGQNDEGFGPQFGNRFDFTLKFEYLLFKIIPSGIFIVVVPFYIWACLWRPVYTRPGIVLGAKLACAVALVAIEFASLALFVNGASVRTATALAAAALACVEAIAITATVFFDHRRALRPTSLFSLYIALGIIFDAAQSRSFFLRHDAPLGALFAVSGGTKLVLAVLLEFPRRHLLIDSRLKETAGGEATRGFWYRSLFCWLNPLFIKGSRGELHLTDLEPLGPELSSKPLLDKFLGHWESAPKTSPNRRIPLALLKTLWWPFLSVVIPRLLQSGFSFSQPFLLQRVLECIEDENSSQHEKIGLIVATGIVFLGRAFSNVLYLHANNRLSTMARGVLVSALADKQLRLSQAEAKRSAIATLMTADVEGITTELSSIHSIWGYLVDAVLGLYALSRFIGVATVVVLGPLLLNIAYGLVIGGWSGKAQAAWNNNIQARVSKMNDILAQLIPIKLTGFGPVITRYAQNLRVEEMKYSKRFRVYKTAITAGAVAVDSIVPVIVLVAAILWTKFPGGFTANKAFPILAAVNYLQEPVVYLMLSLTFVAPMLACIARIHAFLELPERNDSRECLDKSQPTEKVSSDVPVIEMKDVSVNVPASKTTLLRHVNLRLLRGKVLALLGPISCGKSTFLRSALGEEPVHGEIAVKTRKIAYCSQTPWLQNSSIRENVVGPGEFKEGWYWDVIRACQLVDDLERLSSGDMTPVGSDGINLSVGQRVRVALARAVYLGMEILLLDDVFSSLDQPTATAILSNLFGNDGLLKKRDTTVLIATHLGVVLDVADELLVFEKETIAHYKTFDLQQTKSKLIASGAVTDKVVTPTEDEDEKKKKLPNDTVKLAEERDNSARRRGDMGLWMFYFRSVSTSWFILWIVAMAAVCFVDNFPPGFIRIWVANDPTNKLWLIGCAMIALANTVLGWFGQRLFYLHLLPESGERLHELLLEATINATYNFVSNVESGYLLNRFSQDMSAVVQILPMAFYGFIYMFFSILVDFGFTLAGTSYGSVALPFLLVAIYFIQRYYLQTSRQLRYLDLETATPLLVSFKETANGLEHIRSIGWSATQREKTMVALDESQQAFYQMLCIQRWLSIVLDLTVVAMTLVILAIAMYVRGSTSPAALGLSILLLISLGNTITRTVRKWTDVETSLGSIARLRSFVQDTPQEEELPEDVDFEPKGAIKFENVTASYGSDAVLKDMSFEIKAGDKVAVVGRSGGGKSSLLATLLNCLEYSGSISVDGVDIKTMPRQQLRARIITTISQTPIVLAGTIRYNLVPFATDEKGISDATIENTLAKLGMWDVVTTKGGLDAMLDEGGFSVAQQQLVCIARALLHHEHTGSKILIMDEATASLSAESTAQVQKVIGDAFQDCTVLSVAHWDLPLEKPDLTLRMDNGMVTRERGNDAKL